MRADAHGYESEKLTARCQYRKRSDRGIDLCDFEYEAVRNFSALRLTLDRDTPSEKLTAATTPAIIAIDL